MVFTGYNLIYNIYHTVLYSCLLVFTFEWAEYVSNYLLIAYWASLQRGML